MLSFDRLSLGCSGGLDLNRRGAPARVRTRLFCRVLVAELVSAADTRSLIEALIR